MKRIIECLLIIIFGGAFCNAQKAISTAGGKATGAGGTVSFTVGQTNYITLISNSGILIQGIQQPFEILVVTGIESNKEITLECIAYPNPATDFLTLRIQRERIENLSYQLMDINGKILEIKNIENVETNISLNDYQPAAYFLKVIENTKEVKTFKIIKSNQK
jgi:hypothetical protein